MFPGPVFHIELLTTARRARYYAFRLIYGLILLLVLLQSFYVLAALAGSAIPARQLSQVAQNIFVAIFGVQAAGVLFLTPTLVAGVIASERQRKTLHYLLASQLTSAEIVLGKLCARLLHVVVYMAISLPIVSLLSLLGGVDPVLILAGYACTFFVAFFLAAISILVSASTKTVAEALGAAYSLEFVWLVLPSLIDSLIPGMSRWRSVYDQSAGVAIRWVIASSPLPLVRSAGGGGRAAVESALWMVGLQILVGSACVVLAVWRLRPFASKECVSRPRKRAARARVWTRAAIGEDGMIWKERYAGRSTGIWRWIGTALVAVIAAILIFWSLYLGLPAAREALEHNYSSGGSFQAREDFNGFLRGCCPLLCVLAALRAATIAASACTSEKEADTWISLLSTPLEAIEIVRAKFLGAIWKCRGIWISMLCLGSLGVLCGAVHPLGLLVFAVESAVLIALGSALGLILSIRLASTWRAQSLAVAILLVANGGYLACICPILSFGNRMGYFFLAGCMPFIQGASLLSAQNFTEFRSGSDWAEIIATCVAGTLGYTIAAAALVVTCVRRFDYAVDRPRWPGISFADRHGVPKPAKAEIVEGAIVFE
jgi:ABC-type transport system involved in multi-copper enzyme maturation permease subunit